MHGVDEVLGREVDGACGRVGSVEVRNELGEEDDREHGDDGDGPDGNDDDHGVAGSAVGDRRDRVADGEVPVCAHDRQREGSGELVDAGGRVVDPAHERSEDPVAQETGGDDQRAGRAGRCRPR